jgi:hypothetical protein
VTSARERLEQLDKADFDTFGEQDKGPGEFPLATPEEFAEICDAFYDRPWEDPTRDRAAVSILLGVVGSIAVGGGSGEWASHEATQALRRVMARVLRGEMDAEVNRHGM